MDPFAELTPLAALALELVIALNCLPTYAFPIEFFSDLTDASLRHLAEYNPARGHGDEREADPSNCAGSALLLAMVFPRIYGIETAPPLRIFGSPPPDWMSHIASRRPQSGKGVDNRRHNVWEALLDHWQDAEPMVRERDLLVRTLCGMKVAIDLVIDPENIKLVWELPRQALQCSVPVTIGNRERNVHGHMV